MSAYTETSDERFRAELARQRGRVVKLHGREVQCFWNEKDAGAWVQHAYGRTPVEARHIGVTVESLTGRAPRPGDAVLYDGAGAYGRVAPPDSAEPGGVGVLCTVAGLLAVCFHAQAYRDEHGVSPSGGPVPCLADGSLRFAGLREVSFWRWGDGSARAHHGGAYRMVVPCWRWDGTGRF
jgi:hypothetical protein